tara:strand:- start:318 stop:1034 length:717 start_codon:yes stop_codon:yes gene_type:complete
MLGLGVSTSSSYPEFTLTDVSDLSLWLQNGVDVTAAKWTDSSGNSNHATQSTESDQAAVSGGGLDFDGTSDFYEFQNEITIADNGGFCLAFVIDLDNVTNNTIVGQQGSNDTIRITDAQTLTFITTNPSSTNITTNFVADEVIFTTSKALFVFNRSAGASNRLSLFKNGSQVDTDTDESTNEAIGENPHSFELEYLGNEASGGKLFDGKILELAFWSKGLSVAEIADVNSYLQGIHGL